MTDENGPEDNGPPDELLTEADVVRLCKEAKARGEPVTPLLRRYVLQMVDEVIDRLEDELGDILFAVANLARHFDIDPEAALRGTNDKFVRRFHAIEDRFGRDAQALARASLEEMESAWQAAKAGET